MSGNDEPSDNKVVVHNEAKQRFEISIDGQLSILEYKLKNQRLILTHTEVPDVLSRKGNRHETGSWSAGICSSERIDDRCLLSIRPGIHR
jgi:hypothetical protein